MQTQPSIFRIGETFSAPERLEQALEHCEKVLSSELNSVIEVTSIPDHDRVVLMVEFHDGSKIKLVVNAKDDGPTEFVRLNAELSNAINFPRVLAHGVGWTASEWINGPTLREHGLTESLLYEAVSLLAKLHEQKSSVAFLVDRVQQKLEQKLPVLVANDIISPAEQDRLLKMSEAFLKQPFKVSLIHGDFSPDNLIVSGTNLFSIDNDKVTCHATAYDLCRTVSLWDEWNSSGATLFAAYRERTQFDVSSEQLFFWGVFDLVYRISYRIALGERNQFCINRLRQIITAGEFQ